MRYPSIHPGSSESDLRSKSKSLSEFLMSVADTVIVLDSWNWNDFIINSGEIN